MQFVKKSDFSSLDMLIKQSVILLIMVVMLPSCETVPVEADIIRANTVLVLPADSLHKELAKFSDEVQQLMIDAISKKGFRIIPFSKEEYAAINEEALTVSGSVYEPSIGKQMPLNPNVYTKALIDLARERKKFDIVVVPEIVLRNAQTEGDEAVWDGVKREYRWVEKPRETYTLPRKASGLSLRMGVYTDKGNKIIVNFAGISLPYLMEYEDGVFHYQMKENYFTDKELQESVDKSFKIFNQQVKYDD